MRTYTLVQVACLLVLTVITLGVAGCDGGGGSANPKTTLEEPVWMHITGLPEPVEPAENIEEVGPDTYNITLGFMLHEGVAPWYGEVAFKRIKPAGTIEYPLPGVEQGSNVRVLENVNLPPGQYICRITVSDGFPGSASYTYPLAIKVPLPYLTETCDGYAAWADAENGANQWRRGSIDSLSPTSWYVGSEFPSPPVKSWSGPMFHCNSGADGSDGDALYQWGGPSRWWILRSKQILIPIDPKQLGQKQVHPYLFFRLRMELNYYGMTFLRAGWTANQSLLDPYFNEYAQLSTRYWDYDPGIPAYVWPQSRIVRVDLGGMVGQKAYIKFAACCGSWLGNGSGATGWHLDGITLKHDSSPPTGM